jgi:hypothetical protein
LCFHSVLIPTHIVSLSLEMSPIPVKKALELMGKIGRLPLLPFAFFFFFRFHSLFLEYGIRNPLCDMSPGLVPVLKESLEKSNLLK